jgi:murein L,D-transpeptidase YcbB/YkuD
MGYSPRRHPCGRRPSLDNCRHPGEALAFHGAVLGCVTRSETPAPTHSRGETCARNKMASESGPIVPAIILLLCLWSILAAFRPSVADADASNRQPAAPATTPSPLAEAVRAAGCNPETAGPARPSPSCRDLDSLYATARAPIWADGSGRVSTDADAALGVLAAGPDHGLGADAYAQSSLRLQRARLDVADPTARARFDVTLSFQMLRFWRHLHLGRVDPRLLGFRLTAPADDHDFAAMLRSAVARHDVAASTAALAPPFVLYRSLSRELGRYRDLAARAEPLTLAFPIRSLHPGERAEGLASLAARLRLLGDLPSDAPVLSSPSYDAPLVEGLRRFQERHGLEADGIVGATTLAALRVPPAARLQQLEMAMERLRWLPHLSTDGFLAVNIPMFRLWGWGPVPQDGVPAFDMNVIVGKALDTQTPVFVEELRHIIFRPYWNVPASILRGEILPALARSSTYLSRQAMEIVDGPGDDARVVPLSAESLDGLRQGRLRVRQRPGPRNALGLVKFVFPNDEGVYMHGTPTPQLFGRPRRDFSHGCVRVEDPVGLAEWLLRDQPAWTRARIEAAMNGPAPLRVNLTKPLQVVLFYLTAVVMPQDGRVHFANDVYGHDARLARALRSSGF